LRTTMSNKNINLSAIKKSSFLTKIGFGSSPKPKDHLNDNGISAVRIESMIELRKKLEPRGFVKYVFIPESLRKHFAMYCCKRIKKMNGGGIFRRIWRKVHKTVIPKTINYYQKPKKIGTVIYKLATYCSELAPRMMRIFRKVPSHSVVTKIAKDMQNDIPYNFEDLAIYHNSMIFIDYFRNCLDGLLPPCLATTICYLEKKNKLYDFKNTQTVQFWKLLPFTMSGEERDLFIVILNMWTEMEYSSHITYYRFRELSKVFSPAILPIRLLKKLKKNSDQAKFVEYMFHLNYEKIDTEIYKEFMASL
ncbi:hypothetical protein COBT_003499, partial [Conglomerata obtusa]